MNIILNNIDFNNYEIRDDRNGSCDELIDPLNLNKVTVCHDIIFSNMIIEDIEIKVEITRDMSIKEIKNKVKEKWQTAIKREERDMTSSHKK